MDEKNKKNGIIRAEDLPADDVVYMKKDMFGWRAVEPIHNPDNSLNLKRLLIGTKRQWVFTIIVLIIIGLFFLAWNEVITPLKIIAEDPTEYCRLVSQQITEELMTKIPGDFDLPLP